MQKLTTSDADVLDALGRGLSATENWAVFGAKLDDDLGVSSGSAYLFRRYDHSPNDQWVQVQKLTASDGAAGDNFGGDLAINKDWLLAGAIFHDAGVSDAGAVYVFRRDDSGTPANLVDDVWVDAGQLIPDDPTETGYFGAALAISDQRAIVGGCIGGNLGVGAVYVFRRDDQGTPADLSDDTWHQEAKLVASDGEPSDRFGCVGVAMDADWILVGTDNDDDACPQDPNCDSGAVYVFRHLNGGTPADPTDDSWLQHTKLTASDPGEKANFGISVALDQAWAIVGGQEWLEKNEGRGSAYVFRRDDNSTPSNLADDVWTEQVRLTAPDSEPNDVFGWSVSIYGDSIAVGTPWHDTADPQNSLCDSGAAYLFQRNDNGTPNDLSDDTWPLKSKYAASDGTCGYWDNDDDQGVDGDHLGDGIAIIDNFILAAAPFVDDACVNDPTCESGAVYEFAYEIETQPPPTATPAISPWGIGLAVVFVLCAGVILTRRNLTTPECGGVRP